MGLSCGVLSVIMTSRLVSSLLVCSHLVQVHPVILSVPQNAGEEERTKPSKPHDAANRQNQTARVKLINVQHHRGQDEGKMRHASAQVVELVGVIWETVDHKYAPLNSKGDSCELQDAKRVSEGVEDAKSNGVAIE